MLSLLKIMSLRKMGYIDAFTENFQRKEEVKIYCCEKQTKPEQIFSNMFL